MTRFLHLSDAPRLDVLDTRQHDRPRPKPYGLWISDETDLGWRQWCEENSWERGIRAYTHEVTLRPDANVLWLTTPDEVVAFGQAWVRPHNEVYPDTYRLDWRGVAARWQGIVITPYQWPVRLDDRAEWYYGWDCASGCIWDSRAIASVKAVTLATTGGAR